MKHTRHDTFAYIGTHTGGESRGIYALALSGDKAGSVSLAAEIDNPSYLAYSGESGVLYAVSESGRGCVSAWRPAGAQLEPIGSFQCAGGGLVHIVLSPEGRYLFTASYADATAQMFRLRPDGTVSALVCEVSHEGHGVHPVRQDRAYAHSVWLAPSGRELCVCDLGIDRLVSYSIDYERETLIRGDSRSVSLPGGTGPRHLAFSPNGRFAYILGELDSRVHAFSWTESEGFRSLQVVDLLDAPDPESTAAAIRISSDGRFAYASNRGADVIAVFSVSSDGFLSRIATVQSGGSHPRDFILSPDETRLLCANRDTDGVTVFARDSSTGLLSSPFVYSGIPSPVAIAIV